jgi:glutathione S-transferase
LTKIEGGLQECQRALDGRAYFVGNSLTLADLAVVAAAGYVVLRGAVDLEQDRFQPLRAWLAVMHQRPGVAATVPPT